MDQQPYTANKPTGPGKKVIGIIVIVLALFAAGYGYYLLGESSEPVNSNSNAVANANTESNSNSHVAETLTFTNTIDNSTGWQIYTFADAFVVHFPPHWYISEPVSDDPEDETLLLIASNENATGVMGLSNTEESMVSYLYSETSDKDLSQYMDSIKVVPVDIPDDRVLVSEIVIGRNRFTKRVVDATNLPDWAGVYSVDYFTSLDNRIVRIAFVAFGMDAITKNASVIESILATIE